jgi:hypothetical protein
MAPAFETLDSFDRRTIFCIWFGNEPMPVNRAAALLSIIHNSNCPVVLLHNHNFRNWELKTHPFHPAFEYLTDTHKADYLRIYIAYHFGGGYSDIKFTFKDWSDKFELLGQSDKFCLAYPETDNSGPCLNLAEKYHPESVEEMRSNYHLFPGTSAFIFKKGTTFAADILGLMHHVMDNYFEQLKIFPGRLPQEYRNKLLPDGSHSRYPLDWVELLGDNFHYLAYFKYKENILFADIKPSSMHYRDYFLN